MKMCIYCHKNKAEIPDRNNFTGKFIKKVCSICHQKSLQDDMKFIISCEAKKRISND